MGREGSGAAACVLLVVRGVERDLVAGPRTSEGRGDKGRREGEIPQLGQL